MTRTGTARTQNRNICRIAPNRSRVRIRTVRRRVQTVRDLVQSLEGVADARGQGIEVVTDRTRLTAGRTTCEQLRFELSNGLVASRRGRIRRLDAGYERDERTLQPAETGTDRLLDGLEIVTSGESAQTPLPEGQPVVELARHHGVESPWAASDRHHGRCRCPSGFLAAVVIGGASATFGPRGEPLTPSP